VRLGAPDLDFETSETTNPTRRSTTKQANGKVSPTAGGLLESPLKIKDF
jgi:hypothetical protein